MVWTIRCWLWILSWRRQWHIVGGKLFLTSAIDSELPVAETSCIGATMNLQDRTLAYTTSSSIDIGLPGLPFRDDWQISRKRPLYGAAVVAAGIVDSRCWDRRWYFGVGYGKVLRYCRGQRSSSQIWRGLLGFYRRLWWLGSKKIVWYGTFDGVSDPWTIDEDYKIYLFLWGVWKKDNRRKRVPKCKDSCQALVM
jgi:hypothetical protein